MGKVIDEVGHTYGRLTVIESAGINKDSHAMWKCKCKCGNYKITSGKALRSGLCKSCGCMISKGEEKIATLLQQMNINFQRQFYFNDLRGETKRALPLYFDLAIFNKNNQLQCLIEYQGEQHYHSIDAPWCTEENFLQLQHYDQLKREYCLNKRIPLIEIKYLDFDLLSQQYLEEVMRGCQFML